MDAKAAARAAKDYVADLLAEEQIINLGLEEIEKDEKDGTWAVTVGFSRPWNSSENAFTKLTGQNEVRRAYRVVKVRDQDGKVVSFKKPEFAE